MNGLVAVMASLLLAPPLSVGASSPASDRSGIASVIDGDTLELHGERIRLHGIDAPESAQTCQDARGRSWPCGRRAALALADRIRQRPLRCEQTGRDRYRRTLAVCYLGRSDLNAWLVRNGWALAYRRYSGDYLGQEKAAQAAGVGIWVGSFVPPWEWRRRTRQ